AARHRVDEVAVGPGESAWQGHVRLLRSAEQFSVLPEVGEPFHLAYEPRAAPEPLGDLGVRLTLGAKCEDSPRQRTQGVAVFTAGAASPSRVRGQFGDHRYPFGRLAHPASDLLVAQSLLAHRQDPGFDRAQSCSHSPPLVSLPTYPIWHP